MLIACFKTPTAGSADAQHFSRPRLSRRRPRARVLKHENRVIFSAVSDTQALEAFLELSRTEGILPASGIGTRRCSRREARAYARYG